MQSLSLSVVVPTPAMEQAKDHSGMTLALCLSLRFVVLRVGDWSNQKEQFYVPNVGLAEVVMAQKDPFGASDSKTEYQVKGRPRADKHKAKSVAGLLLVCVIGGLVAMILLRSYPGSDPAPGGSPGAGIVREPGPAIARP